ncbi:flagellum-specific peptidoglycan hydrolase FlgJ [Lentzea atacamensis]|uniref:Flagellum-specific peptidoglycan hydrolase FlgJ n=1 Tax=Lentzea atacamensis TaxID=531938 RepID=A0A316I6K1_9PSEU|nr:glucosaminidase domain-containing protein [Lentzea atacamensis]PWK82841.1 flagellum-specific peptidoglycan hydrolase FlgJ [Lentzea atacamensis]
MKKLISAGLLGLALATTVTTGTAQANPDFIATILPYAQAQMAQHQIPASVSMGQAIHESRWGQSGLAVNDKNYFGVKCTSPTSPGPIAIGCREYSTTECEPTCQTVKRYFRIYRSMEDSFRDYGRILTTVAAYRPAFQYTNDPDRFVTEIGNVYATDGSYGPKVIKIMRDNDLYRFNSGVPAQSGSSLTGDGRAEVAAVLANGDVMAWRNAHGLSAERPWDANVVIATGFTNEELRFADVDGDGDKDTISVLADGTVKAWRNAKGFGPAAEMYDGDKLIADGFSRGNTFFADLNGDRRAEIIAVMPNGDVVAWRNATGFANERPWDGSVKIATGFTADNLFFGDLDNDGRAELMTVAGDGQVRAWKNVTGFAEFPFADEKKIGVGFTKDNVHFGDINGDGRAEIVTVQGDGKVVAWQNNLGYADSPFGDSKVIAEGFTNEGLHLV